MWRPLSKKSTVPHAFSQKTNHSIIFTFNEGVKHPPWYHQIITHSAKLHKHAGKKPSLDPWLLFPVHQMTTISSARSEDHSHHSRTHHSIAPALALLLGNAAPSQCWVAASSHEAGISP